MYRIKKISRTAYVVHLEIDYLIDSDETFFMEVTIWFNRFNNNQYTKSLIALRRKPLRGCVEEAVLIFFYGSQ